MDPVSDRTEGKEESFQDAIRDFEKVLKDQDDSGRIEVVKSVRELPLRPLDEVQIPDVVSVDGIGSIDLKEAEAIARENILFLTEDDLVEGLEDFDLIPLKDGSAGGKGAAGAGHARKDDRSGQLYDEIKTTLDENITFDEIEFINEDEFIRRFASIEKPRQAAAGQEPPEQAAVVQVQEETPTQMPVAPLAPEIPTSVAAAPQETPRPRVTDIQPSYDPIVDPLEDMVLIDVIPGAAYREEGAGFAVRGGKTVRMSNPSFEIVSLDELESTTVRVDPSQEIVFSRERFEKPKQQEPESELVTIAANMDSSFGAVSFIDDVIDEGSAHESEASAEEVQLERATSDIMGVMEGKAVVLAEASLAEDRESIPRFVSVLTSSYDDLFLDFDDEYRYTDEELEFVSAAITDEDYRDYLKTIDDFHDSGKKRSSSIAIEVLGLTMNEINFMSSQLFGEEYRNVDLNEIFDYIFTDRNADPNRERHFTYLVSSEESLAGEERRSIEQDIKSTDSLIFEEDVEEIKTLHTKKVGDRKLKEPKPEVSSPVEPAATLEEQAPAALEEADNALPEQVEMAADEVVVIEPLSVAAPVAEPQDITDRVVIIEDQGDVERFINQFPEQKQADLKSLLKYLDGLFEKLPESTIKNFAQSEYFDLYTKVVKELGV